MTNCVSGRTGKGSGRFQGRRDLSREQDSAVYQEAGDVDVPGRGATCAEEQVQETAWEWPGEWQV